jgi:hypothetical protein
MKYELMNEWMSYEFRIFLQIYVSKGASKVKYTVHDSMSKKLHVAIKKF